MVARRRDYMCRGWRTSNAADLWATVLHDIRIPVVDVPQALVRDRRAPVRRPRVQWRIDRHARTDDTRLPYLLFRQNSGSLYRGARPFPRQFAAYFTVWRYRETGP